MTKIGRMLFEDGMKEGRSEERKKTAERLLEKGIDMDVIMDATDLTEAEIREIEESILLSRYP